MHRRAHAVLDDPRGRDANGRKTETAFKTTSFQVGRGENGEAVLSMIVGTAGKISFLLPDDMPGQLSQALRKLAN
jgi:hypothetical protein